MQDDLSGPLPIAQASFYLPREAENLSRTPDTTKLSSSPGFRASRPASICSASISSTTSSVKSQCLLIRIEVSIARE